MTIKEKILSYLDFKGVRKNEFFESIGLAPSNFKGAAKQSELGSDKLVKILTSYPDLSVDWLLMDVGDMIKQGGNTDVSQPQSTKDPSAQASPDIVSTLLATIQEQLSTIQKQAEEIGRLKECLRQADMVKGKNVSDAHTEDIANAG